MGGGWGCQWHAGEPPGLENSFKWGLVFPFHSLNRNTLNKRLDIESLAFYPAGKYTLNLQCHVLFRFQYFFQSLEIYNHLNSTKPLETTTISSDWTLIPLTKDHSSRFIKSLNPHGLPPVSHRDSISIWCCSPSKQNILYSRRKNIFTTTPQLLL